MGYTINELIEIRDLSFEMTQQLNTLRLIACQCIIDDDKELQDKIDKTIGELELLSSELFG